MTNQTQIQNLLLPIQGMTCSNCAAHVESALKKLPGVSEVTVDLNKNQATLSYEPTVVDLLDFQSAVKAAGYSVPAQEVTLRVLGMTCVSCLAHVEGALQNLPGVLEASVSLSKGKAQVQYIQDLVTITQMEAAVKSAGYEAHLQDAEAQQNTDSVTPESGGLLSWVRKTFKRPNA
jgi:Cu+-exporting ATPase